MEISLELMTESLQSVDWIAASCPKKVFPFEAVSIREVALLPSTSSLLDKGILWCGFLTTILSLDSTLREGRSFLAFGTEEEFSAISRKGDCNCLFFSHQAGLTNVFPNVFNEAAAVIRRLNNWEHCLDLAIAKRASIQDLVDIAETVMDNPIIIWNPSFEIQAYTKNIPINRPRMQKILQEGHFSGDDVELLARMNYLKNSDLYSELTLKHPPNWMECPFAIRVYFEGQKTLMSMVQYFLCSEPKPAKLELLRKFEAKFSIYVENVLKTGERSKSYVYEPFLIDLIEGHLTHEDDIIDRLKAIKIPFQGNYRLYQITFEKYTSALGGYARTCLKSIFPAGKIVHYHDCLFLLNKEDNDCYKASFEEYRREKLHKMLEVCSASTGISDTVPNLTYIHTTYLQTQAALRIGALIDRTKRIWQYSEAYSLDMVDHYAQQSGISAEQLYYRPLNVLIMKDQATGNDNLQLLDVYLNCDRNITITATKTNLHRNSVIYRLERIEQMLGGSLNDPDLRFNLLVSLKILRLIELRKQAECDNN